MPRSLMIKTFFTISLMLILTSCKIFPERELNSLNEREKAELNRILEERNRCFIDNINMVDKGQEDIKSVVDVVSWRCSSYETTVNSLLYKEYKLRLGAVYSYTEKLKNEGPRTITEALLAKRQMDKARLSPQENQLRPAPAAPPRY